MEKVTQTNQGPTQTIKNADNSNDKLSALKTAAQKDWAILKQANPKLSLSSLDKRNSQKDTEISSEKYKIAKQNLEKNFQQAYTLLQKQNTSSTDNDLATKAKLFTETVNALGINDGQIREITEMLEKCQTISTSIIQRGAQLGVGTYGTVSEAIATIENKIINIVEKMSQKAQDGDEDELQTVHARELYANFRILQYISENFSKIVSDPFLSDCVRCLTLMLPSEEQNTVLSEAKTTAELMQASQKLSEQLEPIYFEKKGEGHNLENAANIFSQAFSHQEKLMCLEDVLKGIYLLNEIGLAHRDLRPANVFLEIPSDINSGERPRASIGDFGIPIDYKNLNIQDKEYISWNSNDCTPPNFYPSGGVHSKEEWDQYNNYGVGIASFTIFGGEKGTKVVQEYTYQHKPYIRKEGVLFNKDFIRESKSHPLYDEANKFCKEQLNRDAKERFKEINHSLENPYNEEEFEVISKAQEFMLNGQWNGQKIQDGQESLKELIQYIEDNKHKFSTERPKYAVKNQNDDDGSEPQPNTEMFGSLTSSGSVLELSNIDVEDPSTGSEPQPDTETGKPKDESRLNLADAHDKESSPDVNNSGKDDGIALDV